MNLDERAIARHDTENMLKLLVEFPNQCREAYRIGLDVGLPINYRYAHNIVISGMGGSAIGGDLIRCALSRYATVPIIVNRHYSIPEFVNDKTLFIGSSFSGNTEESIEAFRNAVEAGAMCMAITSNGELERIAEDYHLPVIKIPSGMPPRCALGYTFIPVLTAICRLGFAPNFNLKDELEETVSILEDMSKELSPRNPGNLSAQIAEKIHDKIPVFYTSQDFEVVYVRWKGQMSENGKSLAYGNCFPEMNHNEIEGWKHPAELLGKIHVILLRDRSDHERVQKRMDITKELIGSYPDGITEIYSRGEGILARMLSLIYIGDFVSFYLALLNEENPTPVERIGVLKSRLAE
ncbi:TPA: bifunctional phosphoglucose/phosphomannose isomerase [Candidatus Poribacteria bacterium]|nr:bifunctional phosphoglucose/phosphomannose isomerase [Candidatus Poribacteria bacterium]